MPEKLAQKILLLEDDLALNETLCDFLQESDYDVVPVYSGQEAQDRVYENTFDLLLLDVNVPDINGFELLQHLRERGDTTPAIFLTSLNAIEDVEEGFQKGCDDYIRKPFALKELGLRVENILKRNFFHTHETRIQLSTDVSFDTKSHTVYHHNKPLALHAKEQKLLQLFLKHPNTALSHETIMQHLWDYHEEPSDLSLRTYIKNLRKILGKDSIESIKRFGYKFSSL